MVQRTHMKRTSSDLPSITVDPAICHGKPVIAGTRVMVWQILELLQGGESASAVYDVFPSLPTGSVEATLGYAAGKAKSERYIPFSHHDNQPVVFA